MTTRWELGSEFHWMGLPEGLLLTWPEKAIWYLLGRHAVAGLIEHLEPRPTRIWLPTYFCSEVGDSTSAICEVREYRDDPRWSEPDWKSLNPAQSDVVLAVNYFGVRTREPWLKWRQRVVCVLLEDHSQDPFSPWALHSSADYCFASLRKTLPIPDGGILWSPRQLSLPRQLQSGDWKGSASKLAAMFFKTEYLRGTGDMGLKDTFRALQAEGEQYLRRSETSSISPYAFAYLSRGIPEIWRSHRLQNANHLRARLEHWNAAELAFQAWPDGAVPFALILIFPSQFTRDLTQSHLQKHHIYCPVHWICQTNNKEALDLSTRILSLPIDQRYSLSDMDRIGDAILSCPSETAKEHTKVEVAS